MNGFWLLVGAVKGFFAVEVMFPALLDATVSFTEPIAYNNAHTGVSSGLLLRCYLTGMMWATMMVTWVADTLGWYQLVLALVGGAVGVWQRGIGSEVSYNSWSETQAQQLQLGACATLLPALAESEEEVEGVNNLWERSWSCCQRLPPGA